MKHVGYFLLLCGLLSSSVWGQSAPKNQASVVLMKCVALSCSSAPTHPAKHGVKLGTFYSLPTGLSAATREVKLGTFKPYVETSRRPVLLQVSQQQ